MKISDFYKRKIKYAAYKWGKIIAYRHPLKVFINAISRTFQFWTESKYVFATVHGKVSGIVFKKVKHNKTANGIKCQRSGSVFVPKNTDGLKMTKRYLL